MVAKNVKRLVLAASLILLLPGLAGAAGFDPAKDSFWMRLSDPAELFGQVWERLTSLWAAGPSVDPNGGENEACAGSECGPSVDPNG